MIRTSIHIGGTRITDTEFTSVSIQQQIGEHHTFTITLRQDPKSGVLPDKAKSWIGQPVSIGFAAEKDIIIIVAPVPDVFKGIVTSVGLSRQRGTGLLVVRGKSPTIAMDDGPNTRSFTDKGLQEISDEVLSPYGSIFPSAPKISPAAFTESKPYCVQYKESNFAFLHRLANRYGEWFYYDGLDLYFGEPEGGDPIILDFGANAMDYFDITTQALPSKYEMKGYDYLKHKHLSEEQPEAAKSNDLGNQVIDLAKGKIFTETPMVTVQTAFEDGEFKNMVNRREQIALDETIILNGSSKNAKLKVGSVIHVMDSILKEDYGQYTITTISHSIGQGGDYDNSFEAIPIEVKFPPLTSMPNPPFCETQIAKVVDVNDEKSLGRIKVEFFWQEGTGETSPWIRVCSPYTGKDKGFYIIPEVDDQVLIAFENNSPDKPYVLTGMYNNDAKPEWFDPKNRYKGFKSKGNNHWKFDDKNKHISIHAPSSMSLFAGKTINISTGGKDDSSVNINVGEGTVNINGKTINITGAESINSTTESHNMEASKVINIISQEQTNMYGADSVVVNSKDTVEVSSESKTLIKSTKEVTNEGINVKVKGSAGVDINGGLVRINS